MSRLKQIYIKKVIPQMKKKFGYQNDLAVPKIEKVIVNTGKGEMARDEKLREAIAKDFALITGQRPIATRAKKAVAAFKIRKGMRIGFKVTLRGERMYDFIDRLINIALPRTRDFRGIPKKSFDPQGNLTIGIKEHIVFPEISHEDVKSIFGLEVCVVTSSKKREEGVELLKLMGFPIRTE